MKYTAGSIGRVLVAKVEHGDDLLLKIKRLTQKERIRSGLLIVLGAVKQASLVVGPKECVVPPEPVWREFGDGREIMAVGTIFSEENGPELHLHAAFGRGDSVLVGCVREDAQVYLVAEVIILEMVGMDAARLLDPAVGLKMLTIT